MIVPVQLKRRLGQMENIPELWMIVPVQLQRWPESMERRQSCIP